MTATPSLPPRLSAFPRTSDTPTWVVQGLALVLFLLPFGHPILRPALGPPSHLLWFAHVFPVAWAAYCWGIRGSVATIAASVAVVLFGEATFGAGYGVPADSATIMAMGTAVGLAEVLVGAFMIWARAAEQRGQQLQRVVSAGLEASQDAVLLVDTAATILYGNRLAAELFGDDLVQRGVFALLQDDGDVVQGIRDGRPGTWPVVSRGRDRIFPAELTAVPIHSSTGAIVNWLITLRDRTQELQLQEEERRTSSLQQLGTVVAGIAHELNNPLTSVAAYSELLAAHGAVPSDIADMVEAISAEGKQAARIARTLLKRVRSDRGDRVVIDVNAVVRRAIRSRVRSFAAHQVRVQADLAPGSLPSVGNESELQQIIVNLMANAEHAMHDAHAGGVLSVTTAREGGMVMVTLSDTGPGIPTDQRERVFDAFYTTKGERGTGLGLAIARRIAEDHGGALTLSAVESGGACLTLSLPFGETSGATSRRVDESPPPVQHLSVLIVDDQEHIRRSVSRLLERHGFACAAVSTAREAMARVLSESFDAVVSDVHLDGESGLDLFMSITAELPSLRHRFVLMTGDVLAPDVARFLNETGCASVPKPFEAQELIDVLRRVARARS